MKKFATLLLTLPFSALAAAPTYTLLAPLGPLSGAVDLSTYLNGIMLVTIGVAGVLAVVMIVICGIQMIGSPSVSQKSASKECITNAILGLLLAAGSWIILNTINADLLKSDMTLGALPTPAAVVGAPVIEANPTAPGWYFKYGSVLTGDKRFSKSLTGEMCNKLHAQFQADPAHYTILSGCYEIKAGSPPPPPPASTAPPTTTGITCTQTGMNLCEPLYQPCTNPNCAKLAGMAASAAATIGGGASAALIKAIIMNESSCGINVVGDGGASCGPMQVSVTNANKYRAKCGITTTMTCGWLAAEANWPKAICLGAAYLDAVSKSVCGTSVRNIAAGYNGGFGACAASADCASDTSCSGAAVQRWECLYEDSAHTVCNGGAKSYISTRNYATHALYCTNNPGF